MKDQPRCAHCDQELTNERIGWDNRVYCSEVCIRQAEQAAHDAWREDRFWEQRDEYGRARMGLWP